MVFLIFFVFLFFIGFVSAQPEQLKALITDAEIQELLTQAKTNPVFADEDALYYDESADTFNYYYASVCHGGAESIGCRKRKVEPKDSYYLIANPTLHLWIPFVPSLGGAGGAHYLNTKTDDYLVVKLLGELWFIKPHWSNPELQDSCYFDIWKWTPGNNFFIDGSYDLSSCGNPTANTFPKSDDVHTVSTYESTCGIVFDTICRGEGWFKENDIIIKNLRINSQYFSEMKARRDARENALGQAPPSQLAQNECNFRISSIRYQGRTYSDPTSINYDVEAKEPMSVTVSIDSSKCTAQQIIFGLWQNSSLSNSPSIDLHAAADMLAALNEHGSFTMEVSFSDARSWPTKYLGAKAYVIPANTGNAGWALTQAVAINFTSSEEQPSEQPPQGPTPSSECSACSTIIQCLACLDNLLSQSV